MDHPMPWLGLAMFLAALGVLPFGFPVGLTLGGVALAFATLGSLLGAFDWNAVSALPLRLIGLMDNDLLQAIPLFIYLGVLLQQTTLANELVGTMASLFGRRAGGLAVSTVLIGALLAPTTGTIGATVLTLGMLMLPSMLRAGYDRSLACGLVAGAGTFGTVMPPSIILILLADQMRGAIADARIAQGQDPSTTFTIQDIYLGVLIPVGILLSLYLLYTIWVLRRAPERCPAPPAVRPLPPVQLLTRLVLPVGFLLGLLVAIVTGKIYSVEAAAMGAVVATAYTLLRRQLSLARLGKTVQITTRLTAMVFLLLIGASSFTLVFRTFGSDLLVRQFVTEHFSNPVPATAVVFALVFCLGFFLDKLEIILLAVPIGIPPLLMLGADPVWLAVLMAVTVQTAFLMPPTGFAIFFLRSVAPPEVRTGEIYRGVLPFLLIQGGVLALLWAFPKLIVWLPGQG